MTLSEILHSYPKAQKLRLVVSNGLTYVGTPISPFNLKTDANATSKK